MAIVPSNEMAKVAAGLPPWLNSQMSRGQVLKHLITYTAGTSSTAASSEIQDIPLPPGVVIDLSSVAISHDGVGAGNYTLELYLADKQGNLVQNCGDIGALTVTATTGEIVRLGSAPNVASWLLFDPAQYLIDNGTQVNGVTMTYALLKEKYQFVLCVKNSVAVAANKNLSIIMDLVIP
jgi:hypothetical protein